MKIALAILLVIIMPSISAAQAANEPNIPDPNVVTAEEGTEDVIAKTEEPSDPNIMAVLDESFNSRFHDIFSIYVNDQGMVDYARLRRMRLVLLPVLQGLDSLCPEEYDSWSDNEKIAFWINTRNLCILKLVVDNYPIRASVYRSFFWPVNSIMQIDSPWTGHRFTIMGVQYTLDEMNRRILLTRFDDPRIAFALTHAAQWGPRLRNTPYYGKFLDEQLDEQAREYIKSDRGFRIDKERSTVYLSILFKATSFQPDFVSRFGDDLRFHDDRAEIRAMLNFISGYLDRADYDWLTGKSYSVSYLKPDWSLNE